MPVSTPNTTMKNIRASLPMIVAPGARPRMPRSTQAAV